MGTQPVQPVTVQGDFSNGISARKVNGTEIAAPAGLDPEMPSPIPNIVDGDVLDDSNLSQVVPTLLFDGIKNLTFNNCNLLNVQLDPDAGHVVDDCLWIEKDFCSNNHPQMIEWGLPECDDNCKHKQADGLYHDFTTARHIGGNPVADTTLIIDDAMPVKKVGE
jgi:hypothetical protein